MFTQKDLEQINAHGLSPKEIEHQLDLFKSGFPYAEVIEPANLNNGINQFEEKELQNFIDFYDNNTENYNICKFVPASGAATRMFKDLYEYLSSGQENETTRKVLDNLQDFAFYKELNQDCDNKEVISQIINKYGNLPKALIPFHKYEGISLTALEEHLCEGAKYAKSKDKVKIHFTISPEYKKSFEELLAKKLNSYEKIFDTKYEITMSEQKQSTDTIAVNPDNSLFRDENGDLVFRPSGHGALIENLNEINADIIFIKNIDNICTVSNRFDTIKYKKSLAGFGIQLQIQAHKYLQEWSNKPEFLKEVKEFLTKDLQQKNLPSDKEPEYYKNLLNRPIRVCGMVKNTGAPGGGPFWTKNKEGIESLQIIESSQIAPESKSIMEKSSHFNPVDLVCFVKDYNGNKFNLLDFIDNDTGFISEKSKSGKTLKAMEKPGLWNGAMAFWNTVFVEVPNTTFSPVKQVSDLLSPAHKNK